MQCSSTWRNTLGHWERAIVKAFGQVLGSADRARICDEAREESVIEFRHWQTLALAGGRMQIHGMGSVSFSDH